MNKSKQLLNLIEQVKVKVKNPGILEVPDDKNFYDLPQKHFIGLAKKKGKAAIAAALNNLVRFNVNKNPEISKKAKDLITKLTDNPLWINIPAKSR